MKSTHCFLSGVIIFLAGICLEFSSCNSEKSEDVNQKRIYIRYDLDYIEVEDITYAIAVFTFGNATGTLLKLTDPSHVQFNGENLSYNETFGNYYKKLAGFVSTGEFLFVDTENNEYRNNISMLQIHPNDTVKSINQDNSFEYFWIGGPLLAHESVALYLSTFDSLNVKLFSVNNTGSESLILDKLSLGAFNKNQNIKLRISRYFDDSPQQNTEAGGEIHSEFNAETDTITIK